MKFLHKIATIASACFFTLSFAGCSDYLDVSDEVAENLTLDEVFNNPNYMRRWHGNLFNCISEYSSIGKNQYDGFFWCLGIYVRRNDLKWSRSK